MAVDDGSRIDRRQLLLVALAIAALIAAAFLAPMADPPGESGDRADDGGTNDEQLGGNDGQADGGGNGIAPGGEVAIRRSNESVEWDGQNGDRCLLVLSRDPTPGAQVTMQLRHQGTPIAGATIRINGEAFGPTGSDGRLTVTVPYEKELRIRVELPDGVSCGSDRQAGSDSQARSGIERALAGSWSPAAGPSFSSAQTTPSGENGTLVVPVRGPLTVTVEDRPEPGSSVTVHATIRGVPVQRGNVSVNGDFVGRTDEQGRYEVSVPDDGTERVRIRVSRGDFTGVETIHLALNVSVDSRPFPGDTVTVEAERRGRPVAGGTVAVDGDLVGQTDEGGQYELSIPDDGTDRLRVTVSDGSVSETRIVDVLRLEARVQPRGLLLIPGGRATVVATRADEPVPNATVLVAGERVGTTGADGQLDVRLPTDPSATITVRTDRQTTTIELAGAYRATAIAVAIYGLVVAGLAALAARKRGRRSGQGVAVGGAALFVLALAHSLAGGTGLAIAGLVLALPVVAVVAYRRRRQVSAGGRSVLAVLRDLPGWLTSLALWATRVIEHWIDWMGTLIGGLAALLARQPRSLSALAHRFAARLQTIPERVLTRLWTVSPRLAGAAAGAAALIVAAGVLTGWPGALAASLALLLAVGVYRWYTRAETTHSIETGTDERSTAWSPLRDDSGESTAEGRPSLRERWRTFARWVRPRSWQVSSPGEVARSAEQEGYPDRAVRTLTAAFQRREYSERPVPSAVRDRAEAAFERLESHRDGGED